MINALIIIIFALSECVIRASLSEYVIESHNFGSAFGLMNDIPGISLYLSGICFVIIILIIYFAKLNKLSRFGLCMMAGGALSNLIERIYYGYVIDWIPALVIDLNYNLADIYISFGALIIFISIMKE